MRMLFFDLLFMKGPYDVVSASIVLLTTFLNIYLSPPASTHFDIYKRTPL